MMRAEISLPWPDRKLSPNARVHWAELAKAKKNAKTTAFYCVKAAGIDKIEAESLSVRYVFYPPSRRAFDADNLVASLKAAIDGLSLAIGVDDSRWRIAGVDKGPVEKNGRVKVELDWTEGKAA